MIKSQVSCFETPCTSQYFIFNSSSYVISAVFLCDVSFQHLCIGGVCVLLFGNISMITAMYLRAIAAIVALLQCPTSICRMLYRSADLKVFQLFQGTGALEQGLRIQGAPHPAIISYIASL